MKYYYLSNIYFNFIAPRHGRNRKIHILEPMNQLQKTDILLVGGGTGGHAVPIVQVVKYIRENTSDDSSFLWLGEKNSIEATLAEKNSIPFQPIQSGKLRRYFSWKTLLLPFQVLTGFVQSLIIIAQKRPHSIFSKGGYVSLPVAMAGWILRVPVYLHESDSVPGLANTIVAKFAKWIFCSFSWAGKFFPKEKVIAYGPLLPLELFESYERKPRTGKTRLLVNCGSQGSSVIFDVLLSGLRNPKSPIHEYDLHIILGTKNPHYRHEFEQFPEVKIYDFFYDQTAYFDLVRSCDVVITRGSSSIFEFAALGLHMIMIPHPHTGGNHQYYNALEFEGQGHDMILQENLSTELPRVLKNHSLKSSHEIHQKNNSQVYQKISEVLLK